MTLIAQTQLLKSQADDIGARAPFLQDQHPWQALFERQRTALVLPERAILPDTDALALIEDKNLPLRLIGTAAELSSALHQTIPPCTAKTISALLRAYAAFMRPVSMRVRLEVITSDACWKWHRDHTTLRLITTLHGKGTHYLDKDAPQTAAKYCKTGDIGLFKGHYFGNHFSLAGHEACVHRSPPWSASDKPRLLLVIDMPQDGDI